MHLDLAEVTIKHTLQQASQVIFTCIEGKEHSSDTIPAATSAGIRALPGVFPTLGVIHLLTFLSLFIT